MRDFVYAVVICDRHMDPEVMLFDKSLSARKAVDAWLNIRPDLNHIIDTPYDTDSLDTVYAVSRGEEGDYALVEKIKLPQRIRTREESSQLRLKLLSQEAKRLKGEKKRLENRLFKLGAMNEAPCFVCGYEGEGYFNPSRHKCAGRHHRLYEEE